MMNGYNKRGSETVEAAIVLPVIILIILSLIMLMMFFYQALEDQLSLHKKMLNETDTQRYIFKVVSKNETSAAGISGQLNRMMRKDIKAGIYVIDEAQIIRLGRVFENEDDIDR